MLGKRIIQLMLKLFRMWRFTVQVHKMTSEIYLDGFTQEAFRYEDVKYPEVEICVERYEKRLWLTKKKDKRKEVANRIKDMALKNNYLHHPVVKGQEYSVCLKLTEKGENFIDVFPPGLLRELISKEWKFIALLVPVAAFFTGLYVE